jgi:transcriptional regulator with XRE-family HTH domain
MATAPSFPALTSAAQLGGFIRIARERQGLTYAKAAAKCRVSYRFFWELEHGKPGARLDKTLAVARSMGLLITVIPGGGPR